MKSLFTKQSSLANILAFVSATLMLAMSSIASAQNADPAIDGPVYPISSFDLQYVRETPQHIPLDEVYGVPVLLGQTEDGYTAPRADLPEVVMTIGEMNDRPVENYFASAIQRVLETVRDFYVERSYLGVYVAPDPFQISDQPGTAGQDLRNRGDETGLTLLITTGIVTELRTIGSGERVPDEERIDNPLHQPLKDDSPIRPFDETTDEEKRSDLLLKGTLDRYLFFKSRHIGRRMDAAVAAAVEPGTVALDYVVTENPPLTIYAQVANTGTAQTNYWRERFGFYHTQLTNNDDVLAFDFTTANFDDTYSFNGSYEAPFPNDRVRWRIHGNYSEYVASEVGFFGEDFEGKSWAVGGDLIFNFYQRRELFLDFLTGVRFLDVEVDNGVLGTGSERFLLPYVGLQLARQTEWQDTRALVQLEFMNGSWTDIDEDELPLMGRTAPDDDWTVLRWSGSHSVYLEPLLNREAWEDPTTPESSTLAHEMLFRLSGQWAFGNRLIPQLEGIAGGLYTVRGYPESAMAGDSVFIGSIEYRYHVPHAFPIEAEPREFLGKPFRYAPQYAYGSPDWDLILKGFIDAGRVIQSDRFSFENHETLIGVGVGVELLYRRNVNVRLDWGFALEELENGLADDGANRLHFVATLLF